MNPYQLNELANEMEQAFIQPGGWKACRYLLERLVTQLKERQKGQ